MMSDRKIREYRKLSTKQVKIQERGRLIESLIAQELGFKEEEEFIRHEKSKFQTRNSKMKKQKEIVKMMMLEKKWDNLRHEKHIRRLRNQALGEIEGALGRNSRPCRSLRIEVREKSKEIRRIVKTKNNKKIIFF